MAFRQHNPNVITPPNPSVSNKKDVGVIGEKEPTVRSEFVDKENIPPSFSPPMPPSVHGFHDVEMERLVRGVNRFGLNHGSDNPSRVEGSILGLAPAYPPAVVRLTSLKKANSAAESSEPLAQHRFNRSLWNRAGSNTTQQDSIKKLDVLGRGIRSPKRIPFGNVHHGGCDSARNDVKSAEIPPPRADFASIVRCNAPQSPNTLQDQHHQHLLLKEAAPKDPSIPAAVADAIKASRECRGTTKVATVEKAELYLRHAIAEYHAGRITEAPNGSCYNNIVHGYADLKEPAKAEAILHLMWSDFQQGNELAEPNVRIYTSVLYAWEKSKKESAPERCEAILQQMHRLHDSGIAKLCKPDLYAYTVCLHTWADSKRPDAPKRAEQLFRKMKDRYHNGDTELQPDSVCYVNLLNAYANSAIEYAHTEDLLWEMVDDFIAGNESAKPIIRNFNTVLAVWSKSGSAEAPERSEAIIRRLHELNKWGALDTKSDQYTYSLLLKTWTTCNRHNSAQEAEQALYWMESLHSEGDQGARLDVIKYTTVISALARSGNPGSAETLLEKMLEDYQKGNSKAKPDAKSFNMVLSGWSRYHNATVAAARAQALLHRMWNYRAVHIAPDTWSYNTVLFCWKNANGPKQGESLLLDMDRMAAKGFAKARPNSTSFQAVIDSWKKSNFPFKHQHIHQLQEESQKRFGESAKSKNMDSRSFK